MFSSITKKTVMALSGAALSAFIIVHTIGNATSFFGKEAFLSYAEHLHSLGVLIYLFEISILTIFLLHLFFGVTLFLENLRARPNSYHVKKNDGGRTLGSRSMPYTGVVVFIFVLIHLKGFHFAEQSIPITEILRQNLQNPAMAFFYIIALLALTLHVSHGFWSLFQSLGINHPKYNVFIQRSALTLSIITGTVFILIPLSVQLCDSFLQ
jgi:succinate dehydrogenase / fumarate reductase cytochrome b subunit